MKHLRAMLFPIALFLAMAIASTAFAQAPTGTNTSSTASAPANQPVSLGDLLSIFSEHGFGASLILNTTALGFDGKFRALEVRGGLGVSYKFNALHDTRFPLEAGFYVAPELQVKDPSVVKIALLAHLAIVGGFGLGLGWDAYDIGGSTPGLERFNSSNTFAFVGWSGLGSVAPGSGK